MMQTTQTRPTPIFLALLIAAALVIAACGGDDKDDGGGGKGGAGTGSGPSSPQIDRNRALLDSLGSYPQAVVVREYVTTKGGVGREYGTFVDLPDAPTTVTVFYRDKLKALG
ncbi:MAG TPA: hypothetical protein VJB57_01570, partial [Dehalococcoidia bacterium]|nr:hypothetical protein [Dehalococcoidia bacterium]